MNTDTTNASDFPLPDEVNRYHILAKLPPEQMLDIKALARCLACSTRTVWRRVYRRQLPPPILMGNTSIWTVGHIRQWVEKLYRTVEAVSDREAARLRNFEFRC